MHSFFTGKNFTHICSIPRPQLTRDCFFATASNKPTSALEIWVLPLTALDECGGPLLVEKVSLSSAATSLTYVSSNSRTLPDMIVISDQAGRITLFDIQTEALGTGNALKELKSIRPHRGAVTGLDVNVVTREILSVGEDGSLNLFSLDSMKVIHHVPRASESSLQSAKFISANEIVTAASTDQICIWDVRSGGLSPSATLSELSAQNGAVAAAPNRVVLSLDVHPSKPWRLCSATSGSPAAPAAIMLHDLRKIYQTDSKSPPPFFYSTVHESHIWHAKFHPVVADALLSCSEDGSLFLWDLSALSVYENPSTTKFGREADRVQAQKLSSGSLGLNAFAMDPDKNCAISVREDESVTIHVNLL